MLLHVLFLLQPLLLTMRLTRKKLIKVFITITVIYVTIGLLIYLLQDMFILHPKSLPSNHKFSFDQPFKEYNITTDDNRNLNIIQFLTQAKAKGVVLYFHGNMTNIERYADQAKAFTKNNYEVWMIDYPGFGKSTGKFKEATVYKDAVLFYELAIKQFKPEDIIIFGRSLGTGIATHLAANKKAGQLILETPYYSMAALAQNFFPVYPAKTLIKYNFNNYKNLQQINIPVTILHGTQDEVVPYKHSKKLKNIQHQANLVTIPNGRHNNLSSFPQFGTTIDSLLNDVAAPLK